MREGQNSTVTELVNWLPIILGGIGLALCLTYQTQRYGFLIQVSDSYSRFVQYHLDAFGGFGALAGLIGILDGLIVLRIRGQSRLVTIGTGISVFALLYSVFGLSL